MNPKIPKGWRKLRTGQIPRKGDRLWVRGAENWYSLRDSLCELKVLRTEIIIRRIAKKGRK